LACHGFSLSLFFVVEADDRIGSSFSSSKSDSKEFANVEKSVLVVVSVVLDAKEDGDEGTGEKHESLCRKAPLEAMFGR
jgi:hypothetical protein